MSSNQRSASYTDDEDIHLCHVYLDISQNPIIGINQSRDQFWSRVEKEYNETKPAFIFQGRPKRSLQCRMQIILAAVRKLIGCIRQIECMNPSGASEHDIIIRAKALLAQDSNYKKGFKFDHVWLILKDIEKFSDNSSGAMSGIQKHGGVQICSSETSFPTADSPTPDSPGLSSFSLNISDDNIDQSESQRPTGQKKAKRKKQIDDEGLVLINSMKNDNQQIFEMLKKGSANRQQNYDLQMIRAQNEKKKLSMAEYKEDNKILLKDLNSINDPSLRQFFENEQRRIMEKRSQQAGGSQNTSGYFGQYFNDIGGSGKDLPDY